ncbi:MAG: chromosomal replication initiator protein DnaA [Deinococcales bacterium]
MNEEYAIWQSLLKYIEQHIPEVEFRTWFKDKIKPLGIDSGIFMIGVPHSFAKDWLKSHYSPILEQGLRQLGAHSPKVGFEVVAMQAPQAELFDPSPSPIHEEKQKSRSRLNTKYTFGNFVVGPNNNLAHAAALATAESPGRAYNPLFIYGDAGLGKTHLMHAVGQAVSERMPYLLIEYVTTETFTNELINAIREDKMVAFRERYRSIDLLLVDDVQFIAGKERTQDEFFHTFNALYESGKQIILSSDRPPKDIPTLENRLRSRFEWGLITDIQAPDLETRIAILRMNAEYRRVSITDEVVEYIAYHVTTNIRELEGALMRVIVYASMNGTPLNRHIASKALSDVYTHHDIDISMKDILNATAKYFAIPVPELLSKGRRADIVNARQIAMYLMRDMTEHSYPDIGHFFSGRDHSTVMHAVQKVEKATQQDSDINIHLRNIKSQLLE